MAGKSSLPLQILLYFNMWWSPVWLISTLILLAYKGLTLPYPPNTYGAELIFIIALEFIDFFRIFIGTKGNKTLHLGSIIFFLLLTAVVVMGCVYFMLWQVYVMRLDVVMNSIEITFAGAEFLVGVFGGIDFVRNSPFA